MDLGSWWIVDVIGPVILLLVLIGTVRSNRNAGLTGRSDLRPRQERRRREGIDEF